MLHAQPTSPLKLPILNSIALVVDDDPNVCDVLCMVLENEGFTVVTANSGEEALTLFGEYFFDIVFTDVCMDGISGLDLLARIKNIDKSIKTIVMTAYTGYDTVLEALRAGAHDFIEKPITDHSRIASIALKARSHALLERDNHELLARLKIKHAKLTAANEKLLELNQKLEKLAITDSLTGLKNRRYIDSALSKQFALYARYKDPFCIAMIDVDNFKEFNDQHGHSAGDKVLKLISEQLRLNTRNADTVGRYGGEEFFLLLASTAPQQGLVVAQRVLDAVRNSQFDVNGTNVSVTISIGLSGLDGSQEVVDEQTILDQSDQALYFAKQNGRNQIQVYSSKQ